MTRTMAGMGVWSDRRESNLLDGGSPNYRCYEAADGKWVAVGALEPQFYAQFVAGLGVDLPGGQHDVARWPEHRRLIAEAFASRTREEWTAVFEGTDACVTPVRSLTEAPQDPHLAARGTYVTVDGVLQPAPAPRFGDGTPGVPVSALPPGRITRAGADTREVLTGLGFADVDDLLAAGAVQQR